MDTLNDLTTIPAFDEIVFERRNKQYGAYVLRRDYRRNVSISLIIGIVIAVLSIVIPFQRMKSMGVGDRERELVSGTIIMSVQDENVQQVAPPPPPPPPANMVQQAKYIPPVVVDSVKPEENFQLMTADEADKVVQNTDVFDIPEEVLPEVPDEKPEQEIFFVVEEPASFPGGEAALLKFVYDHVEYPAIAVENNIQGRVIVKFCVTPTGGINNISLLKGVDPELDKEVLRVVSILPAFKPGKQAGKPVPVWYTLPVMFKLNQ